MLNRAIAEFMPVGPLPTKLTKLDELVDATSQVTERLKKVLDHPKDIGAEELRHMRMFCLALSKSAWALERSPYDKRPEHPFRR